MGIEDAGSGRDGGGERSTLAVFFFGSVRMGCVCDIYCAG